MRSPIWSVTFMPSEARTCGEFKIRVVLSVTIACNNAEGRVVVKSALEILPSFDRLIPVLAAAAVVLLPDVPLDCVTEVERPGRGVKESGRFKPAVNPEE